MQAELFGDTETLARILETDDPETIKTRIKEFNERTMPMLDYFEKNGFEVHKINGEQFVADIFKDILMI